MEEQVRNGSNLYPPETQQGCISESESQRGFGLPPAKHVLRAATPVLSKDDPDLRTLFVFIF